MFLLFHCVLWIISYWLPLFISLFISVFMICLFLFFLFVNNITKKNKGTYWMCLTSKFPQLIFFISLFSFLWFVCSYYFRLWINYTSHKTTKRQRFLLNVGLTPDVPHTSFFICFFILLPISWLFLVTFICFSMTDAHVRRIFTYDDVLAAPDTLTVQLLTSIPVTIAQKPHHHHHHHHYHQHWFDLILIFPSVCKLFLAHSYQHAELLFYHIKHMTNLAMKEAVVINITWPGRES
jgi:hypothetical protein